MLYYHLSVNSSSIQTIACPYEWHAVSAKKVASWRNWLLSSVPVCDCSTVFRCANAKQFPVCDCITVSGVRLQCRFRCVITEQCSVVQTQYNFRFAIVVQFLAVQFPVCDCSTAFRCTIAVQFPVCNRSTAHLVGLLSEDRRFTESLLCFGKLFIQGCHHRLQLGPLCPLFLSISKRSSFTPLKTIYRHLQLRYLMLHRGRWCQRGINDRVGGSSSVKSGLTSVYLFVSWVSVFRHWIRRQEPH